jgi:protein-S-isoprenylcysteine O-methyltransferase Ste14
MFDTIVTKITNTVIHRDRRAVARRERTFERDLAGYADYRTKVRYRLVPFVW